MAASQASREQADPLSLEAAVQAVQNAQAQSSAVLTSQWSSTLVFQLRPLAEQNQDVRRILVSHGWCDDRADPPADLGQPSSGHSAQHGGGQFAGPPDLDQLLVDLQACHNAIPGHREVAGAAAAAAPSPAPAEASAGPAVPPAAAAAGGGEAAEDHVHAGLATDEAADTLVRLVLTADEVAVVDYKPLINFVDNPPPTLLSAREHAEECIRLLPRVPAIMGQLLDECSNVLQSKLAGSLATLIQQHNICTRMAFSITLYTLEITLIDINTVREDNFYLQLNEMLRIRDGAKLKACHGHLFLLMTGLDRLPRYTDPNPTATETVLFRGIDDAGFDRAKDIYKQGNHVHWSAFSSATVDVNVAKRFAGPNGIVLKITLLQERSKRRARDIRPFSPYGDDEKEILLLPNFRGFVAKGLYLDSVLGRQCIDILEAEQKVSVF